MLNRGKNSISKTEWTMMNICWKKGKSTARVIFEESLKEQKRAYQTVKTMLDRLAVKGFLKREKFGPLWLYDSNITRDKAIKTAINNFVDTVLDNDLVPLFLHFAEGKKLSSEDIEAVKMIINKSKKK